MRRLLPWGLAAAVLAACQSTPPAAPPTPPAMQPSVPASEELPAPRSVLASILFLSGPDTMAAGETVPLKGRVMLPAGSHVLGLDVQAQNPSPSPTPRTSFGLPSTVVTYVLRAEAEVPHPDAPETPHDFEVPFTPPSAGTYHLDLQPRRITLFVTVPRSTTSWPRLGASPSPTPMPELWGVLTPTSFPEDVPLPGTPDVITRPITSIVFPASARAGQRVQMTARFWTNGLGKASVDAYWDGQKIRVIGLSLPDRRAVAGPIPLQVEVPFSVLVPERGTYPIVASEGEGAYGSLNVY